MPSLLLIPFPTLSLLLLFLLKRRFHANKNQKLPPGPPGKPLIGNVLDMRHEHVWIHAAEWARQYGDVIHLNILGKHLIFLNSQQAVKDLLEKRSGIYSDRPYSTMMNELMGCGSLLGLLPYGSHWRSTRRIFHDRFTVKAVKVYQDTQTKHTHILLRQLHLNPKAFMEHFNRFASALIMEITYGIEIGASQDSFVDIAKRALKGLAEAAQPGAFFVDLVPWLKYWPAWAPGGGFHRKASEWKKDIDDSMLLPFVSTANSVQSGEFQPSFVSTWLGKLSHGKQGITEANIRDAAGGAFAGGFETTHSSLDDFFLAMATCPEIQAKAQEELDRVVGRERLPDFSDEERLPYIAAICLEIFRWQPVLPMGIPHRTIADDEYRGMFIPKGSTVIGNGWAILRNEEDFGPDVDKFKPERFLEPGVKRPDAAFGFGRRICPGRHFATKSFFIVVSSVLHMYKIEPQVDETGKVKPIKCKWTSGLAVHPEPFECSITPRFPGAIDLLKSSPFL